MNKYFILKLLLCFLLVEGYSVKNVEAGIPPIVTGGGAEIYPVKVKDRLIKLLWELKEPGWSKQEINRIMPSVISYLRAFSGRQFDRTLVALQRGDKYRPMIREQLKAQKLPIALEALPMAESAYRYNARSNQGAYGLWQFMPASAKRYGLNVSKQNDERKDPLLATNSALKYLKDLNKKFARISILLSIAAYNAGEGRIQRIVNESGISRKSRGYSRIVQFLPKETRGYVPEFLAATLIIKDPGFFGFPVSNLLDHQYIQIPKTYSLNKLVKLAGVSIKTLYELNPELEKQDHTPTNNFILRLPNNAAVKLSIALPSSIVWQPASSPIELERSLKLDVQLLYTVRTGNYLGGIAKTFKVEIKKLREWNNIKGNNIKTGQQIIINTKTPFLRKVYQVRSGDNFGLISQTLGVTIDHILFVNGMGSTRQLKVGNRLFYYENKSD